MADSPEAIQKATKLYLIIGATLFGCTLLTVAVATFEFLDFGKRGFDAADATIGLLIAAFKSTLVAAIFMHLNHEKKLVYWTFGGALFFGAWLVGLIALAFHDPIHFEGFLGR